MSRTEDELALRGLMDRYIDAVNRRCGEDWAATWAEDASWSLLGQEVSGRAAILALWQELMAGFEFAIMMPSSGVFDIDADTATGHYYLQEYTRNADGDAAFVLGRYRDSYRRIDGQWFYQSRHYEIIYFGPPDLSGQYTALS